MTIALEREARELSEYERTLLEILEKRLANRDLEALGTVEDIADRMLAALPDEGTAWAEVVGPVFTSKGLQNWLGISRQAISQHVLARRILRLKTSDNISVFPGFQFDHDGGRLPHLSQVLGELVKGIADPWTWASWLNSPDSDGVTHAERLRQGEWEAVVHEASEDAAAWSRP